jgi:hypothetical protein
VKNGAARCGNVGVAAAEPWFGVGGGGNAHGRSLKPRISHSADLPPLSS